MFLLQSAHLKKINIWKIIFQEHYQSVKRLGSSSVGPDLGPNCLQKLSADEKSAASKRRVMVTHEHIFFTKAKHLPY